MDKGVGNARLLEHFFILLNINMQIIQNINKSICLKVGR